MLLLGGQELLEIGGRAWTPGLRQLCGSLERKLAPAAQPDGHRALLARLDASANLEMPAGELDPFLGPQGAHDLEHHAVMLLEPGYPEQLREYALRVVRFRHRGVPEGCHQIDESVSVEQQLLPFTKSLALSMLWWCGYEVID
jgi:hypothetical protein